jgi:hypothetical protein
MKGFIEVVDLDEKVNVLININNIVRVRPSNDNTLLWLNIYNPTRLGYTLTTSIPYEEVKALMEAASS